MRWIPKPQEIYKHFKGNLYQIITLAQDSESDRMMVVYQALYGDFKVYVRPLEMFVSKVDRVKYPETVQEYRFERQKLAGEVYPEALELMEKTSENRTADTRKAEESTVRQQDFMEKTVEESAIDPLVWEFLDADSHEQRLNILAALHHRITDDMITTMAVACDVEIADGDIEQRYSQLKNCLIMLDKFEIKRKY